MNVTIAAEQENYLLVARGDRFAVMERRNNRLPDYPSCSAALGVAQIVNGTALSGGW
jgi:hypothetical protein